MYTASVTDTKILALTKFLKCDTTDIEQSQYSDNTFIANGDDYLVLRDDEADDMCTEYIHDSLWAFNAEFIARHTKNGLNYEAIKALKEMQGKLCESANDLVLALIDDIDKFTDEAIASDGRGHFLSTYDGEENESDGYYIYKQ